MPYFRIKDMPGFTGLIAKCEVQAIVESKGGVFDVYYVDEIINPNVAIGDSTLKWPLEYGSMFINKHMLQEVEYEKKTFTAENPFGEFQFEGHFQKGPLKIDYAKYSNGLSVNICEITKGDANGPKTIYSQNFFGIGKVESAVKIIQKVLEGKADAEDLVFTLKDIATRR
jgi:hypothetical protein